MPGCSHADGAGKHAVCSPKNRSMLTALKPMRKGTESKCSKRTKAQLVKSLTHSSPWKASRLSDFVITPLLNISPASAQQSVTTQGDEQDYTWPGHLRDGIVEPPIGATPSRTQGVFVVFEILESFMAPQDQQDAEHNLLLGMTFRLFDSCLAGPSSSSDFARYKSNPLLAAACLMVASKCVTVSLSAVAACVGEGDLVYCMHHEGHTEFAAPSRVTSMSCNDWAWVAD